MAWSELKMIPNEYNDEVKAIDESLIRLLTERLYDSAHGECAKSHINAFEPACFSA
ncbi:hypothetical protein [Bacillus sp. 3255]|uniref:hypothetical protein n=1 Tax=Bacillus sp. 3255 TaxID=2817904 RepID=UPI00286A2AF0|nr:hypothetical protein [Bacillus sp. 3255]